MRKSRAKTFSIISLGCPKNTVDSEVIKGGLIQSGLEYKKEDDNSDVVVINTCGFLESAREESVQTILNTIERKKTGDIKRVVVMGCMAERYADELKANLKEVDNIFGVNDHNEIINQIAENTGRCFEMKDSRSLLTRDHFAYLKIAEGCDNKCSFCSIPLMRGNQKSRSFDDILSEAKYLHNIGVKELLLTAQDLTRYGSDLKSGQDLYNLLDELLARELFPWVRLMYSNPAFWDARLTKLFGKYKSLCPYIDIPVQHSSDKILKSMRRGIDRQGTIMKLKQIRNEIPDVVLRTSVIVGFPGESNQDFNNLLDFIEELKFERLGVFTYSEEEDTHAITLQPKISQKTMNQREEMIMDIQYDISSEFAKSKIGQKLEVLIEDQKDGNYIGRTVWDAPEIDCNIIVKSDKKLKSGKFYNVRVTNAQEFDLKGIVE